MLSHATRKLREKTIVCFSTVFHSLVLVRKSIFELCLGVSHEGEYTGLVRWQRSEPRTVRFVNILGLQSVVNGTICQTYLKNIVRLGAIIPFRRGLFSFVGMLRDDDLGHSSVICDSKKIASEGAKLLART